MICFSISYIRLYLPSGNPLPKIQLAVEQDARTTLTKGRVRVAGFATRAQVVKSAHCEPVKREEPERMHCLKPQLKRQQADKVAVE